MFRSISGNSVTSSERVYGKKREIDERKVVEDCQNINKIFIESTMVNVQIVANPDSSSIEAYLRGETNLEGDFNFDIEVVDNELRIKLPFKRLSFNEDLKLEVTIPKKIFEAVSVKNLSAFTNIDESVLTEYLELKTKFGDVKCNTTSDNVYINTTSGDVEFTLNPTKNNSRIDINTTSGNVNVKINNIGHLNLLTSGKVVNDYIEYGDYSANIDISTNLGNIKIS